MSIEEDPTEYKFVAGDPYLTQDLLGKYVILQDETLSRDGYVFSHSEILIDDNPSDHVIFVMKLRGAVRVNPWETKLPTGIRGNIESTVRRLKCS